MCSRLKNSIYPISLKQDQENNKTNDQGMECNINNIRIIIWKKLSIKIQGGIEILAAVQSIKEVIDDLLNERYNNEPHEFTETIIENNISRVELNLNQQLFEKTIKNFCIKHAGEYNYEIKSPGSIILAYKRLKEGKKIKQPKITVTSSEMNIIGSFSIKKMIQLEQDLYQSENQIK